MKIKIILRSQGTFLYLVVSALIILSITPLQAQVKRDHRIIKKAIVKSQTLNFDEADAIFGTRTEIKKKYPTIKFTRKIDRTMITKKLSDGENLIHKTVSGNTVYAIVKKGKITGFEFLGETVTDNQGNYTIEFFDRQYRRAERKMADVVVYAVDNDTILAYSLMVNTEDDISDGSSNTIVFKNKNKTCFNCREICYDFDGGPSQCDIICVKIDCSKPHNASLPGKVILKE